MIILWTIIIIIMVSNFAENFLYNFFAYLKREDIYNLSKSQYDYFEDIAKVFNVFR